MPVSLHIWCLVSHVRTRSHQSRMRSNCHSEEKARSVVAIVMLTLSRGTVNTGIHPKDDSGPRKSSLSAGRQRAGGIPTFPPMHADTMPRVETTTIHPALAVVTRGLTKVFGDRRVVDNLDLTIPSGSVCGFVGPNGAGKTTTIRMLLGLSVRPVVRVGYCSATSMTHRRIWNVSGP